MLSVAPERFPGGEQTVAGSFFHCLLALGGGEEGQKRKDKGPLLTPVNAAKDAAIEESERSRGGRGGKVEICWNLALRSLLTDYSFLLFIKRNTDIHFQRPRPTHFHLTDYSSFYGLHPTQLFTSLHLMCCCVTISMSSGRTPSSCSVLTSLFHEPGTSVLDAL